MLFGNKDSFYSSFPARMPFISLLLPNALTQTSSTTLNRSGECPISEYMRKALSLSPLNIMLDEISFSKFFLSGYRNSPLFLIY